MLTDLALLVNGGLYRGWQSADICLSIEQLAASFTLSITETGGKPAAWAINTGDLCVLQVAGKPVITGAIDNREASRGDSGRSVVVSGRSKTADLVDCSAIHKTGSWSKAPLEQICRDLCAPFGITVQVACGTGKPFPRFAIEQGESCFETMDRACKLRGVLAMASPTGELLLTRAGTTSIYAPLDARRPGIEAASKIDSLIDRFDHYLIKGQSPDEGVTPTKASALDTEVKRYRPLIIIADSGDAASYADRGRWECNVRRGRGQRYCATVTGWQHAGAVWAPNHLVRCIDPDFALDEPLLLAAVNLRLDNDGSRADLEFSDPSAYEMIGANAKVKKAATSPW